MRIGVTSRNGLKVTAVAEAYASLGFAAEVTGHETDSLVGEQPVNGDALRGARNRIADLRAKVVGLDRIVSIENGIFRESDHWMDCAVVVIINLNTGKESVVYSEGVEFPDRYVDAAMKQGFDKVTVGKVMADAGYVADAKDPHLTITGRSRKEYLLDAIKNAIKASEQADC